MTKVIGKTESIKSLINELDKRNIDIFKSLYDIRNFQQEYNNLITKTIYDVKNDILKEIEKHENEIDFIKKEINELPSLLNLNIEKLDIELKTLKGKKTNFFNKYYFNYKIKKKEKEKKYYIENFDNVILNEKIKLEVVIKKHNDNILYLTENKEQEIKNRSKQRIANINYIKKTIDDLNTLIAGAIGENLVAKELSKLSDDYILFNDFRLSFNPPIYNKQKQDRIFSIQIDHLLVAPSGIFLIETKNWSKKSIESLDLRSPVEQIYRTSYALFVLLNSDKNNILKRHHWGEKKIPLKNLLVLINNKPKNDFKYIKVLNIHELNRYIKFFDPIFEKEEVENIVNVLNNYKE